MLYPILLQEFSLLPAVNAITVYITIAIVGGFILLLYIGSIVGNQSNKNKIQKSKRKFKKMANKIGISPKQIELLENLADKYKIFPPSLFITVPSIYTVAMKKEIRSIAVGAYSPEAKEDYKFMFFSIKQKIDRNIGTGKMIKKSIQFSSGQNITIETASGHRYSSHVIANLKDFLCVEVPKENGLLVKFEKLEQVQILLWKKWNKGYTFESKITDFSTIKNKACIMLQHSDSFTFAKHRSFPRKNLNKICYYKINIVSAQERGKAMGKKAVIEHTLDQRCSVIEISAGGCSIKTKSNLKKGDLLKIEFNIKNKMSALGKVVNFDKTGKNSIAHIQFTRMSKAYMNLINSYVYDIDEKDNVIDH